MEKILGLDLGTNSIGWAVVEYENGYHKLAECENKPTKGKRNEKEWCEIIGTL